MNTLKINTKKGYFEFKDVYKLSIVDNVFYAFYGDNKVKIPTDDIISFEIKTEEDGE